jgi:membrane-associated phospholipid phosphatase
MCLSLLVSILLCIPAFGAEPEVDDPQDLNDASPVPPAQRDNRDAIFYPSDTERPVPLLEKLGRNVLLDQKDIWTSPFHMNRHNAGLWLGFAAITAGLVASDHWSSTQLENSVGQVRWANHVSNIGSVYTVIPVAAGFYGFGVLKNDSTARETGVLGAEAMLDGIIVAEALKFAAGRTRPNALGERGSFFDGGASFPSGHAMSSWALASVIAHKYSHHKIVPIVAYGLASVVSTARFAAQQHYASDIVAGGAMGWFIGHYVYRTHDEHAQHQHAWLRPQVLPQVDPVRRNLGVTLLLHP